MTSRGKARPAQPRSVFINCPFDAAYKPLLRAACFAIMACGHLPLSALNFSDSGAVRLVTIAKMIAECGLSLHDISRVELDATHNLPRFNMSLELGMDLGLRFEGPPRQRSRKTLILDAVNHRYDKTLSDISGLDIQAHGNEVREVIRHVRDWLNSNWDAALGHRPAGAAAIHDDYLYFLRIGPDITRSLRLDPLDDLPHLDFLRIVEIALPMIAAARDG